MLMFSQKLSPETKIGLANVIGALADQVGRSEIEVIYEESFLAPLGYILGMKFVLALPLFSYSIWKLLDSTSSKRRNEIIAALTALRSLFNSIRRWASSP